ncbi:MAG TPA: type II secretion system protein GspF [Gammaproteobacteria bacterium]|nr:type II secretion system protein GspF [Gammaproteobacteria bacterium]
MGAFEYTALDDRGKERKGVLEGDAPRQIRQQLRDKGWVPVSVAEISQEQQDSGRRLFELRRGVSATDLALITRQFATLVRSGLPIEEALRAVSQQCEKTRLKNLLLAVRSRVMEGHPLATALADYPRVFSDLYRATIAAGEQSGHLDEVLDRLADYTENRQVLRDKIVQALIYPILVIVVAILVVAGLMTYVVPQIIQVFENMGQELPPLTVGLIAVSDFTRESGPWIAALLIVAFIGLRMLLRRKGPRKRFHHMLLTIPLLRHLVRGLNAARFARTLSILSASGVPVLESLRISAQVVTNLPMQEAVDTATRHVREGASLSRALDRSGYFPPMTIHLIASGESSGKLEVMLERAADSQERELESLMQTMLGLFGPLVILVMGGIVLVIILAMLLPIINLNQLVI